MCYKGNRPRTFEKSSCILGNRILVTKPFLPPIEEYQSYLDEIWRRNWLTNDGPCVRELEEKLANYFGVPNLIFLTNGTIAIQLAVKALDLKGEILTTPFSYVATTSSIVWENCKPVFVDIDADRLTINEALLESKISSRTTAILATHVFGNPCHLDAIDNIAKRYNLKVIYDAAHCFGSNYKGRSVMQYGDISCISFHATKLFHTIEGGAVTTSDDVLADRLRKMRNFGHDGPLKFDGVGINGKNSEFHAAMGLVNLNHMPEIFAKRRNQVKLYQELLKNTSLVWPRSEDGAEINNAYCAVLFQNENELLKTKARLLEMNIETRRYFNPSLNKLGYVDVQACPISEDVANRVLCLPLYHELKESDIVRISQGVIDSLKNQ